MKGRSFQDPPGDNKSIAATGIGGLVGLQKNTYIGMQPNKEWII